MVYFCKDRFSLLGALLALGSDSAAQGEAGALPRGAAESWGAAGPGPSQAQPPALTALWGLGPTVEGGH